MFKKMPFRTVAQQMLDKWLTTSPESPVEPEFVYGDVVDRLSIKMRLTLIRIKGENPLVWHMAPIRHSGFATSLLDINKIFREQLLGDFKDQTYMREAVIPRLQQVIENQRPSIEFVKTKLFGINLGYDRILLPQRTAGQPEWVISSSYGRFLLDAPATSAKFDVEDEGIVQLLIEGRTAKEIATQLSLSHRTVEHRLERLKTRFGARNTVHLVVMLLGEHINRDGGTAS